MRIKKVVFLFVVITAVPLISLSCAADSNQTSIGYPEPEQITTPQVSGYNTINNLGIVYPGLAIKDITFGDNGKVYFGGYPDSKVFSYDQTTGQIAPVASLSEGESVQTLLFSENKLYIGCYGGGAHLYSYSTETGQLQDLGTPFSTTYIQSLCKNDHFIYGATSYGKLFIYDESNTNSGFVVYDLPDTGKANIAALSNGVIVGGTEPNAQIFSYNPNTAEIQLHYQFEDDVAIAQLAVDENDIIWGSTTPGHEVFRFDYDTGEVRIFPSISDSYFWDLVPSPDGRIFFSTSPDGLLGFFYPQETEPSLHIISQQPFPNQPVALSINPDGLIIAAGFCANSFTYDTQTGNLTSDVLKLGNIDSGFLIVSLYADEGESCVWGGTGLNRSLFVYDTKNNLITKFGNVLGTGNIDSITKSDGRLYLGLYALARLGIYDLQQPFSDGNPYITEQIEPTTSRISDLISDGEGGVFGSTTCDRLWCQSAGWFIYSNDTIIKKGDLPDNNVTSLIKIGNYLYGGTYPNGYIFQINLNDYTSETMKIENTKMVTVGSGSNSDVFVGAADNRLLLFKADDVLSPPSCLATVSTRIKALLLISDTVYFSAGSELMSYDLSNHSLRSYGHAINPEEQITSIVYVDGLIIGATSPNGYLFAMRIMKAQNI